MEPPLRAGQKDKSVNKHAPDPTRQFHPWPFDKEAELEATIAELKTALFGESRICLDVKKLIGEKGRTQN